MLRNSLLEILRKFSKEGTKKFNDLIFSPFFNKKSPVTKLWDEIKKHAPGYTSGDLNSEAVWKNIFPDKKFNYGVMKNLIRDLQKLSERYIDLEIYRQKKFEQRNNLLTGLLSKDIVTQFEKNLKSVKSEINRSESESEYFYYMYVFEANEQNYFNHFRKTKEPEFSDPFPMIEYLSSSFFVIFFSENYNSLMLSKFYNKTYDTGFIKEAFKFFENSLSKDDENVRVFYYGLKILMDTEDDESYYLLKKIVKENIKRFNPELVITWL